MNSLEKPAMTPQQEEFTSPTKGRFTLYKEIAIGKRGWGSLIYFEICQTLLANLGGLLGFALRSIFFPRLFGKCGAKPAFGRGLTLRNPGNTTLGKKNLIDDFVTLDVRGEDSAIYFGDYVSVGRLSTIAAKGGQITFGDGVNIGTYCRIATNSKIEIGDSSLIAAYAYIGPGNHQQEDPSQPLISQKMDIKGGVSIGKNCWIGTRATILDGVKIGDRAIIGAHSLVLEDVPADCIAVGTPAKVIRKK